jgi:nitroreductase
MEAWDAIQARRNVRNYLPDPVPEADLDRIAEAAWRAPISVKSPALGLHHRH